MGNFAGEHVQQLSDMARWKRTERERKARRDAADLTEKQAVLLGPLPRCDVFVASCSSSSRYTGDQPRLVHFRGETFGLYSACSMYSRRILSKTYKDELGALGTFVNVEHERITSLPLSASPGHQLLAAGQVALLCSQDTAAAQCWDTRPGHT